MKSRLYVLLLLATAQAAPCSPTAEKFSHTAPAPISMDGKLLVLNFYSAEETRAERGEQPKDWKEYAASPMALQFPVDCNNTYHYQLHESTPDSPWPPVNVTYTPDEGCIQITGNDMHVQVVLSFTSSTKGSAAIEWHDEGGSWYVRNAIFTITPSSSTSGLITMPQSEEADGAVQSVDDGLGELVRELENRKYKTAVEKLYQKRLLTLLPQIMEGSDINNVLSNANGTTALHNACGLSHVEIVQWLVDHGADLDAKTAKGASIDDCVGGANAKEIRAILRKAKTSRK